MRLTGLVVPFTPGASNEISAATLPIVLQFLACCGFKNDIKSTHFVSVSFAHECGDNIGTMRTVDSGGIPFACWLGEIVKFQYFNHVPLKRGREIPVVGTLLIPLVMILTHVSTMHTGAVGISQIFHCLFQKICGFISFNFVSKILSRCHKGLGKQV